MAGEQDPVLYSSWNGGRTRCFGPTNDAVPLFAFAELDRSPDSLAEHWIAENLSTLTLCARLEPLQDMQLSGEWQRCNLIRPGAATEAAVNHKDGPVVFLQECLQVPLGSAPGRDLRRAFPSATGLDSFLTPSPRWAPSHGRSENGVVARCLSPGA